jgi:hypothetical protein
MGTNSNKKEKEGQLKPKEDERANTGQAARRLKEVNEELEKLKESKPVNGAMRRQKITMEREKK